MTKKRRVDSGTAAGGGSQPWYSRTTTSLLFADTGDFDEVLKNHLIANQRQDPDASVREEITRILLDCEPDIYVAPALIKTKNTDWHLIADDWNKVHFQYIPLREVRASLYATYDGYLTTVNTLQAIAKNPQALPREDPEMQTKYHRLLCES